jgi:hypothetical protein
VLVTGCGVVREEEECVMVTNLPEHASGEKALVMGIERREVDERWLKVGCRPYILTVAVLLEPEGTLEEGWASDVGHLLEK